MEAKKLLARTIVAGFHSEEAAREADANWAKQFQHGETPEDIQKVPLKLTDYFPKTQDELDKSTSELEPKDFAGSGFYQVIALAKVLSDLGLAESNTDAVRKLKAGSVKINSSVWAKPTMPIEASMFSAEAPGGPKNTVELTIQVGRRAKIAVLK